MLFAPTKRIVLAPPVSRRAVALWRAKNYNPTLDVLLDETGNGLHARLGSAVGADSNDPLLLTYDSKKVYFPGSTGNYINTPDSVAVSITGDLDLRAKMQLANWQSTATTPMIISKLHTDGQGSYDFWFNSVGNPIFRYTPNGTYASLRQATCSADTGFAANAVGWVRVTYETASGNTKFYTSTDGVTWVQIGATVVLTAGTIFDGTNEVELGTESAGSNLLTASMYYAEIRSGVGGTIKASFDASQLTEPYASWTNPSTGEVWTLNRSATGRKLCVVDRTMLLLGTDDYMEVAHNALLNFGASGSFTAVFFGRVFGTPSQQAVIGKRATGANAGLGWEVDLYSVVRTTLDDGPNSDNAQGSTDTSGYATMASAVINRQAGRLSIYRNGTAESVISPLVTGSLDTSLPLMLGARHFDSGTPSPCSHVEFFHAAIFREALSTEDIIRLKNELRAYA